MIKSVVFDCYGVLVVDSWIPFKRAHFGDDPELLGAAQDLNTRLDRGLISFPEFVSGVAELAALSPEHTYTQLRQNPQNVELFDYIRQSLHGKYSIGLLSNAGENYLDTLFTSEQNALFDAVVLSCDIGYVKPDSRAYQAIVSKLGIEPHEAVFIDDQPRYVEAANAFGMSAIRYEYVDQAIAEIDQHLQT